MKFSLIILLFFVFLSCKQDKKNNSKDNSKNQPAIIFDSTSWTYQAEIVANNYRKRLTLLSYAADSVKHSYSELRYENIPLNNDRKYDFPNSTLTNEIPYIKLLWDTLNKKVIINLSVATIGFPAEYNDVLKNYISLIQSSKQYEKLLKLYPENEDICPFIESLLKDNNIYKPFDSLCNSYGYQFDKYYTEKDWFLRTDFLKENNFDTTLKILMPMMFGIGLKRIQ